MACLKLKVALLLASLALSAVEGQPGSTPRKHKQPKDGGVTDLKKQIDSLLTDRIANSLLEQLYDLSTSVWDRLNLAPDTQLGGPAPGVPELEDSASVSKDDDSFDASEPGTPGVEAQGQPCEGGNCQRRSVENASGASEEEPEAGKATPGRVDDDSPKDVELAEILEPFVEHEEKAETAEPAVEDEGEEDAELVEPAQPIYDEADESELEALVDPALKDDGEEEAESAKHVEPVVGGTEAHEQPCEEGDKDCHQQQSEKDASGDRKEKPEAKKLGLARYDVDAEQKEPQCDEKGCEKQRPFPGSMHALLYVESPSCSLPLTLSSVRKSNFVKYPVPMLTKGEWKSFTTRTSALEGVSVYCTSIDNRLHFTLKGSGHTPNKGGKIRRATTFLLRRFKREQIFEKTVRLESACDCEYESEIDPVFSLGFREEGDDFESVNVRCTPIRSYSYSFSKESSLCSVPPYVYGVDESVGKEGVLKRLESCIFRVVGSSFFGFLIEKSQLITVTKSRSGEAIFSSISLEGDPFYGLHDCLFRRTTGVRAFLSTGMYMEEGGTTPVQGQALFIYTGAKRRVNYTVPFALTWGQ